MPNKTFDKLPSDGEIEKLIMTYSRPIDVVAFSMTSKGNLKHTYPLFSSTIGKIETRGIEVDPEQRLSTVKRCCHKTNAMGLVMLAVCFSNFAVWVIVFGAWLKKHDINKIASVVICLSATIVTCCGINALLFKVFDTDVRLRSRNIYTNGLINFGIYKGNTYTLITVRDIEEGLLPNQNTVAI